MEAKISFSIYFHIVLLSLTFLVLYFYCLQQGYVHWRVGFKTISVGYQLSYRYSQGHFFTNNKPFKLTLKMFGHRKVGLRFHGYNRKNQIIYRVHSINHINDTIYKIRFILFLKIYWLVKEAAVDFFHNDWMMTSCSEDYIKVNQNKFLHNFYLYEICVHARSKSIR
jgi:hypothetical protein